MPYAGDTIVGCKNIRQTNIEPRINAFLRISDHRQSNTLRKTELFVLCSGLLANTRCEERTVTSAFF